MLQVFKNVGLALLSATTLLVVGVCLLIVLSIPGNRRKDREYETKLAPSIAWVESFQRTHHRLPSDAEFERSPVAPDAEMIELLQSDSAEPAFKSHGSGKNKGDFAVRIWRGEDSTYYFSWNKSFDIVEP